MRYSIPYWSNKRNRVWLFRIVEHKKQIQMKHRKIVILLFITSITMATGINQAQPNKTNKFVGTIWVSNGEDNYINGDTLSFKTDKIVEYFLGEISWIFDSEYLVKGDTLEILTKTVAFELENTDGIEPDLMQRYLIQQDSLILKYLANKRNNKWIKADNERMKRIKNFYKLK